MKLLPQKINNSIPDILSIGFGQDISENILMTFQEIQNNFRIRKWKPSEFGSGHFVEAVRRAIEKELFGLSTPFSQPLSRFDEAVLKRYEQVTGKDETFRIIIPRVLFSIYTIRNKRGVGHIGLVVPNELDATFILYASKWVLAELVRAKSILQPAVTSKLVDSIVEREITLLWKNGSKKRILDPKMPAKQQVLLLLLDEDLLTENKLRETIEYQNPTIFRSIIISLHKARLIDFDLQDKKCSITPKGILEAEGILLNAS
jgi:hypothetical protein